MLSENLDEWSIRPLFSTFESPASTMLVFQDVAFPQILCCNFANVFDFAISFAAGRLLGKKDDSQKTSSISYQTFALCAVSYIGAMFASNQSLQHVNYPTQVLAKSAKPISVMAVGFLLGGFRYPLQKCLYVLMISVGVVFFVYKEPVLKQKNAVVSGGSYGIGEILLVSQYSTFFLHCMLPCIVFV